MHRFRPDILVVGGGAAGMTAALAASKTKGLGVTLVDDNPRLGGQIWRAELGRTKSPDARKLIAAVEAGRINILNNVQIYASPGEHRLLGETPERTVEFEYEKLIIATGARERFLPFPGWTLPGVFGAGGLQALVKGGLKVENKRIVVSGTGALLLAVAEYLRSKGAKIVAIAEQTSTAKLNKFAFGLWRSPSKLSQAIALRAKLLGVPYLTDCWVASASNLRVMPLLARGLPHLEPTSAESCRSPRVSKGETLDAETNGAKLCSVTLTRKNKTWSVECDMLACGFHLVPNTELASMLGCKIENGFVAVDDFQMTSCENVYCAGEPTGIAGVEASLVEGKIAGLAAIGETTKAREFFGEVAKARKFGKSLDRAFALRNELKTLADDATIVCRCEDVEFGRLKEFDSWRTAKLQTRCGMGACQGRVCGAATEFLFGWEFGSVRPPIFPVKMENL